MWGAVHLHRWESKQLKWKIVVNKIMLRIVCLRQGLRCGRYDRSQEDLHRCWQTLCWQESTQMCLNKWAKSYSDVKCVVYWTQCQSSVYKLLFPLILLLHRPVLNTEQTDFVLWWLLYNPCRPVQYLHPVLHTSPRGSDHLQLFSPLAKTLLAYNFGWVYF